MNKKIKVAILVGGPSSEHEISLRSGAQVLKNLDANKYAAKIFRIGKSGRWPVTPKYLKNNFNVAFIAMHGEYGEDGQIQSILEKSKISFTGSGAVASQLGMDKAKSAEVFKSAGLFTPSRPTKFPIVVKPADRGSSVGVHIAKNDVELGGAVRDALKHSPSILIQECVKGREFTCGVLEKDGEPFALLPTEIIPKTSPFFDYRAKYTTGASLEITPPKLPKSKIEAIRKIALTTHQAIGARGVSRTDMILGKDGRFYVLEINTIPGLTPTSLLPQQAKAVGIEFAELLDIIIGCAV